MPNIAIKDGNGAPQVLATALTDTELRAAPVPVSGPLTDAQMRATAVPVSGPLTDAQMRATAVPVSMGTAPRAAQADPAAATVTLVANAAATALAANANAVGCRILNWTAAPVYVGLGAAGTPNSGAPSDYIPAAAAGVPGQWEAPFRPTTGLRVVGAAAGDLSVVSW